MAPRGLASRIGCTGGLVRLEQQRIPPIVMAIVLTLLAACGQPEQAAVPPDRVRTEGEPPRGAKLRAGGGQREPVNFLTFGLGAEGGGAANVRQMLNEFLVVEDERGVY